MASPRTSRLSFTSLDGVPLASPSEWTQHLVAVDIPADQYKEARLLRQGELLPLFRQELGGEERVLAHWPRSGTGRFRLTLHLDGAPLDELVCTVLPQKITDAAYRALINDLQGEQLPTSIAIGLQRTGALAGLQLRARDETTQTQELVRLRLAIAGSQHHVGLAAALRALARDPHRILKKTETWVAAERVRRLEPLGLVRAVQAPQNVSLESGRPIQVPDVRVEHTVDVYENRLVKLFHEQAALRLRRLITVFEGSDKLAAVAELEQLDQMLRLARREADFLDEVKLPRFVPNQLTMVLLRRPEYRAILEGYLEFHREVYVEFDEPRLDAPLENLPDLYEMWGTLRVIEALVECGASLGYETRVQRLVKQIGGGLYVKVLPDNEPAIVLVHPDGERVVHLTPQRRFTPTSRPFHSISFKQIPDIVIEVDRKGTAPALYVFDPKYKLRSEDVPAESDGEEDETEAMTTAGQPKKIDIDKMHAYRDAIRDEKQARVVRFAAILYPGPSVRYGDQIEALSAVPTQADAVGARLREILLEAIA